MLPAGRQSVGDQLAIGWRLFLGRRVMIAERSAIVWRLVDNRSTIDRRAVGDWKLWWDYLQPLRLVGDQSTTRRGPVTKNLSTIDLVAERFHVQRAKPPCDQIVLATFLRHLRPVGDSLATPCNLPATARNNSRKDGRRQVASYMWPGLNCTFYCLWDPNAHPFTNWSG